MRASRDSYDVVVVGGGHNGLVAASYLSRAGLSVLVLERLGHTGGAAVSSQAFRGLPVRLSRYSYLVSLMPEQLMRDLDLGLDLVSRRTASYTPVRREGIPRGLLVERPEAEATRASFRAITGGDEEYDAWRAFYARVEEMARVVAPTLTEPLPLERELRSSIDPDTWRDLVTDPIGVAIEREFSDDTVRGVVGTDALIGTFASLHDTSLVQNRCFLYHLIGNGTGEWRVPVGGMGAVSEALLASAFRGGTEILTGAEVTRIDASALGCEVIWRDEDDLIHEVACDTVLSGVAPWVLGGLLGDQPAAAAKPQGSQLKINMVLERLPEMLSGEDPRVAFAGTLHLNEGYTELERAYADAAAGRLPDRLPGEVYCHSLSDPSILGTMADQGAHTLTYFGVHTPAALFETDPEAQKLAALTRALQSINQHLAEPIEDCLARDVDGKLCLEVKVPQDIEADLAMPGGHIFHGDLEWPWAANRARLDTPADQWGVATGVPGVLLCGSGARRGGAVSGIGGHNAAQAVLAHR